MKTTKDLFKKIIKENNIRIEIERFQRPLGKLLEIQHYMFQKMKYI